MAKRSAKAPDLVVERGSDDKGVGRWVPLQKHKLLCDYLHASRHAWKQWPNRVLIDPFCGPGRIQVRSEAGTREGGAVLAWRTLATDAPFTKILVGDKNSERVGACEARLKTLGAPVDAFHGPAAETVHQMIAAVPKGSLCMAYIDPYNLQHLSFSILQALAPLRVDLAINFSDMDLRRNVDNESHPDRFRFDDVAPGWREHIQKARTSRSGMSLEYFSYWRELVSKLGFGHSKEIPPVFNDHGSIIYRMVFFSKSKFPDRIWNDVARGPNMMLDLE